MHEIQSQQPAVGIAKRFQQFPAASQFPSDEFLALYRHAPQPWVAATYVLCFLPTDFRMGYLFYQNGKHTLVVAVFTEARQITDVRPAVGKQVAVGFVQRLPLLH